ncbi:MAG: RNA methyltransferase [Prevotella sp.]|uniref:RNA methyltransferase n=1 Tax=Prevotella sp. TaxID=59823 RepID=UPI002A2DEAA6|nr:RNA methyltransferase [Prevotella sp.]MDD7318941.1 RNA methyltransferase [Prevotellaceae bacterium]MDY4019967.1 RNA methyltransferase [Prevotella sp.]
MPKKLRTIEISRLSLKDFREAEKLPLTVVLDGVRSMYNIGSVFRTCDAFRVEEVLLCGITATPPHPEIHKTALGGEDSVAWRYFPTTLEAVDYLRAKHRMIYSIEQCEGSVMLGDIDSLPVFAADRRSEGCAVIFGNEVKGVMQEVIDRSDGCIEIPQYGTKHSLNVAVTAGIVVWEVARRLLDT